MDIMTNLEIYEKAMKNKEVLKGIVKVVQRHPELETDVLILDLDGVKGIIVREEVDLEVQWKSLVGFVGREVSFVVKEIDRDAGVVICSRKEAQAILKEKIIERLKEGEVFSAKVINILNYGAYVEIDGVTGLLKNVDFAEDYTTIGEVLKIGDTVNVKLKKISANGKLNFEAVEKYKSPTIMNFDMFERDQVVLGVVRNVKPWGVYVCIAPGLDALAPIPGTGEIEEGMKVSFRITQVRKEEKRVRGKIVRIL
jgi:small subunit ribosomal protein S1